MTSRARQGCAATEVVSIAAAEPAVDPRLPGDHVHTRLTLTADLAHRYRRETVRILGNVVEATHGESREEAIGSGDSDRVNQTFALWQSPLTWLADNNPLGATPVLEIRIDGVLWHEVDSLAGRGPTERVYITGATADGLDHRDLRRRCARCPAALRPRERPRPLPVRHRKGRQRAR